MDILNYIKDLEDPSKVWRTLHLLYYTNTIVDTIVILNKWDNLQMTMDINMTIFMTNIYEIQREYTYIG